MLMSQEHEITNAKDDLGNTELMYAALNGQTEQVATLIANGADVNAQNLEGRTALMFAVINLQADTVEALLRFGAKVNIQAHCGCTPLTLAAGSGDIGITTKLLDHGADPGKICRTGKTAMIVAKEHHYNTIVRLLERALRISLRLKPAALSTHK